MSEEEKKASLGGQISRLGGVELGFEVHKRVLKWSAYLVLETMVILLMVFLVLKPQWIKVMDLRQDAIGQLEKIERYEEKIARLDDFELEFSQHQSWIDQVLPQDKNLGLVLTGLRKTAAESGVELISYSAGASGVSGSGSKLSSKGLGRYQLEIQIEGNKDEIQRYLNRLNSSLPLKNVEEFSVSQERSSAGGELGVRLRLAVFYLKENFEEVGITTTLRPFDEKDREILGSLGVYEIWQVAGGASEPRSGGNENLFGL